MLCWVFEENLVSCSYVVLQAVDVNTLCDVGGLLLEAHQDVTGFVIEAWTQRENTHPLTTARKAARGTQVEVKFVVQICGSPFV